MYLLRSAILATALLLLSFSATLAVTADPHSQVELTQPDGSTITARPAGDERTGRLETTDGYTLIKAADGWYRYATLDSDGKLVPSTISPTAANARSFIEETFLTSIPKSILPDADRLVPELVDFDGQPVFNRVSSADPEVYNLLMILIKFPDEATNYSPPDFDDLMNEPGYFGIGSINDYYNEISYGQFGVNGNGVGWYTAANPRVYYEYGTGDNWGAAAELAREAILAADAAGLDFSLYDNDGNGYVDGVFIVHGGPAAENGYNGYPWSHAWSLTGAGLSAINTDGVIVNGYSMEPEKHGSTNMVRIGVFCHEYGHMIGLPDLYDTDYSSIGIGKWCLMAGGSWNGPPGYQGVSPAHMSAWCKAEMGWVTPINVINDLDTLWIPSVEDNPVVYRMWNQGMMGNEYFLVEYRMQKMFDQYLPGCGLAIWHIDENIGGNWDDNHRLVDLEERDGSENNSAQDMFLSDQFNLSSSPNSQSYAGSNTNVDVTIYSNQCIEAGMLVDLSVGLGACNAGIDSDGDGFNDCDDNCRFNFNPGQEDVNSDGIGDACEDWDSDGLVNADDNCINTPNNDQADWDSDDIGDVCDDSDIDGVFDSDDNCVSTFNPEQDDWNNNGIGDECDACCGRYNAGYTGNVDCTPDASRNLGDITRMIDHVYISQEPLCCNESGNIDGDLEGKVNLADISALIDHVYISQQETEFCL